jgi:two-component system nitrate/nitrite response regulator NarL
MGPTVVIVDDHAGFRSMARRLLEDAGFDVIGEVGDGGSALAAVSALRPQLVLLDIQLPDMDGFAVADALAAAGLASVIVLTSSRSAADYGLRLASSPASAFLAKADLSGRSLAQLLEAAG